MRWTNGGLLWGPCRGISIPLPSGKRFGIVVKDGWWFIGIFEIV